VWEPSAKRAVGSLGVGACAAFLVDGKDPGAGAGAMHVALVRVPFHGLGEDNDSRPRETEEDQKHSDPLAQEFHARSLGQNRHMRFLAAACIVVACLAAEAKTLRWSSQGDYLTADPHGQNEGINNLINDEIYERLVMRGKKLELVPGLATSWEMAAPTRWRFHLRKGVVFHDGSAFTADDVVFSDRARAASHLQLQGVRHAAGKVRKVDDFTVEFETPAPTRSCSRTRRS
jgi:hypothetical protein